MRPVSKISLLFCVLFFVVHFCSADIYQDIVDFKYDLIEDDKFDVKRAKTLLGKLATKPNANALERSKSVTPFIILLAAIYTHILKGDSKNISEFHRLLTAVSKNLIADYFEDVINHLKRDENLEKANIFDVNSVFSFLGSFDFSMEKFCWSHCLVMAYMEASKHQHLFSGEFTYHMMVQYARIRLQAISMRLAQQTTLSNPFQPAYDFDWDLYKGALNNSVKQKVNELIAVEAIRACESIFESGQLNSADLKLIAVKRYCALLDAEDKNKQFSSDEIPKRITKTRFSVSFYELAKKNSLITALQNHVIGLCKNDMSVLKTSLKDRANELNHLLKFEGSDKIDENNIKELYNPPAYESRTFMRVWTRMPAMLYDIKDLNAFVALLKVSSNYWNTNLHIELQRQLTFYFLLMDKMKYEAKIEEFIEVDGYLKKIFGTDRMEYMRKHDALSPDDIPRILNYLRNAMNEGFSRLDNEKNPNEQIKLRHYLSILTKNSLTLTRWLREKNNTEADVNITIIPYFKLVGKQGNQISNDFQLREEWIQFMFTQTIETFTKPELGVVAFLDKKLDSNADVSVYLTYLDCATVIGKTKEKNENTPIPHNLIKGTLELEDKFGIGLQFDPIVCDDMLMGKQLFYTFFIKEILQINFYTYLHRASDLLFDLSWRSSRSMRFTLIVRNKIIEGIRIKLLVNLHYTLVSALKINEKRAVLYQDSRTKLIDKLRGITFGMMALYTDDERIYELDTDPLFF